MGRDLEDELLALHGEVEQGAATLATRLGSRLRCKHGCNDCCVDDLTVFEVEAARIRRRHGELLARGTPHPPGKCAFLDASGGCRIYEDRPYVCRTQGLPLRWVEDDLLEGPAEVRDICPLNEPGEPPLVQLGETDCWTLGPYEGRLADLQVRSGGAPPARVRLRDLFERG